MCFELFMLDSDNVIRYDNLKTRDINHKYIVAGGRMKWHWKQKLKFL